MADTYTVTQLTARVRDLFERDPELQDVWVQGEISNFTRATSGHLYFTLKDRECELRCVMWRTQAAWLSYQPQHGDAALAHGRVTVYEARGQYQLYCDALQPVGVGDLNLQFELLKAKLDAEGLFDVDRKRPLPRYPRVIGVVTSPTTAAFQDIKNILRRRYPLARVVLSPTAVQGKDAPPQIIAALRRLNDHTDVDVIILARGGGSLEELWCFNDETVVRAVSASRIPVVAGVGHEIDFTLVDFAADMRAPTPSAAAEVVTPDGAALQAALGQRAARMTSAMRLRLDDARDELNAEARLLERLSPAHRVANARQRLDDHLARAASALRYELQRRRERVAARARALDAANPLNLLQRGYALITETESGRRVTSAQQAPEGASVDIALQDGHLTAQVRKRSFVPKKTG